MKELCNSIELYPVENIQSFNTDGVVLKSDKNSYFFSPDNFSISPVLQNSSSGALREVDQTLSVDKASEDTADYFRHWRSVVIRIETLSGNFIYIGSLHFPAKAILITQLSRDQLKIISKTPKNTY